MKEYIEREAAIRLLRGNCIRKYPSTFSMGLIAGADEISQLPAADVVSKDLYEQIKWERDVALAQLKDCGVSLGEKADVVEVRHGRWLLERTPDGKPYCFHCSVCDDDFHHIGIMTVYDYCPNCGAKMDKEE